MPWNEQVDVISSGESSSSDSEAAVQNDGYEFKPSLDDFKIPAKEMTSEGILALHEWDQVQFEVSDNQMLLCI